MKERIVLMIFQFFLTASFCFENNSLKPISSGNKISETCSLYFVCDEKNDLYSSLLKSGYKYPRFNSNEEAIEKASEGQSVLFLADNYPESKKTVSPEIFKKAEEKNLNLFIEYCSDIPGLECLDAKTTKWERCVVSSNFFGDSLPELRIIMVNDCKFIPVISTVDPILVMARVAGYDKALFGMPEEKFPILFKIRNKNIVVSSTKLSNFISGRYAPSSDWRIIWMHILKMLAPKTDFTDFSWIPAVHPKYQSNEKLPDGYEKDAFNASAEWYYNSKLLVHETRKELLYNLLSKNQETSELPAQSEPIGDGTLGFLEGFASTIKWNGTQMQRLPIRTDCNSEAAMVFSLDWILNNNEKSKTVSNNILNYIFYNSNIQGGVRGNPEHPAYGLIAWGTISPAWEIATYGDDEARVILAAAASASALNSSAWNIPILKGLLANLRTTGPLGFRERRIDIPALEQNGWKYYRNKEIIYYSPHYESYLWACYLWAYSQTGYKEFLNRTKKAIRIMMEGYPDKWIWQDNIDKARMLLCLSWLIRAEDTEEHRKWLYIIFNDLIKYQEECGAIREKLALGDDVYKPPKSNAEYGTAETPLIQSDEDRASDQLYTTGFALLGLHEAASAVKDMNIKKSEDKLAEYLCRIQISSDKYPYLNGAWYRSFDFAKWDYWASSGDVGWGAWCIESGCGQAWTAAVLGLRQKNVSLWEFISKVNLSENFNKILNDLPQD